MVQSPHTDRAVQLAREAVELVDAGHHETASRNLREAISLAPDNEEVKSAFKKVSEDVKQNHPLVNLVRRYVIQKNEDAGREAALSLRANGFQPPPEAALDALNLILSCPAASLSDTQDEIITGLVRNSAHIRLYFATQLQRSVTQFFDDIYDRGDGAVVCLDTVVLDPALWRSESGRSHCEGELFQLFIAKLMESGHDLDGRSLKGIARLLAVDAGNLQHLVDEECFDAILSSLDLRLPVDVRSQATLSTAKYLEAAGEAGQKLFSKILTSRAARQRNDDYVIAFSAAAAVFPIIPAITATLFLTDGFIQSLVQLLEQKRNGNIVERAVLELFNAACIDKQCREAISKYCGEWLTSTLSNGTEERSELAAVILAKIRASENGADPKPTPSGIREDESSGSSHDLVERFKNLLAKRSQKGDFHHLVEALAFSSVKPEVKEQLASNGSTFPSELVSILKNKTSDTSIIYGGLTVIHNLTKYLPNLSEEQKKISELRSYANASSKPTASPDPLDDDNHVKERCATIINAGIMPLLIDCNKATTMSSTSIQDLSSKILLSLSKTAQTRGKLAQQGAVKLLLSLISSRTENGNNSYPANDEPIQNAAHALARILISVNPSHIFSSSGFPQITSAIRPLIHLLQPNPSQAQSLSTEYPRDLLPTFESLLALTNLASTSSTNTSSPTAASTITTLAFPIIEDLLLSNNTYLQRAACELTCNLTTSPNCIAKFAGGSPRAAQRLHILLALADVPDLATRRAAGGALAVLTEFEGVVEAVLARERGIEVLLGMCEEAEGDGVECGSGSGSGKGMEMVHRGLVCVRNMACCEREVGKRAREVLREKGAMEVLRKCLVGGVGGGRGIGEEVLKCGVEALRALVET
ncbi:uncharacterized protein PADG_05541 [Paracoccidioides brasiliensis Pb18]|uniref:UNC-45/Cro1/She4 central domain-containing protein n=1 Tax=Paracoccidioides brasiliensis (strain Pb18) TaxID=502780 RepID=C1GE55_PARBD|nr:uncharacterized protein PADG_05541 [Paracoccidioides brasiliensis Pb18]EEH49462.2 hypothetical protein PADG_05541 [Paracoccidioides brasiliensis Pb18]